MRSQGRTGRISSRGSALAEVGIIIPLLTLVTFSLIDFAGVFYAYLTLQNGVSQATRYAVTGRRMSDPGNAGTSLSREDSIRSAMRQATPTIRITDDEFAFYNITTGASGTGGPNDIIRVTVNHDWKLLSPVLWPFFNADKIRITASATMKNEPFPTS
jgi:Flp pilus assembly protein TadG